MPNNKVNRPIKQRKTVKFSFLRLVKRLIYLFLIISLVGLFYIADRSDIFDPSISWEGDEKTLVNIKHYENSIKPLLDNKYLIELSELKEKIESHPWIAKANIKRLFWNKIHVKLEAHDIALRWGDDGYISSNGMPFKPNEMVDSDKPIAIVPESQAKNFFKDYKDFQLLINPLKIARFERNHIDRIWLDNSVQVILGNQMQNERLKRFVEVYEKLKSTSTKIKSKGIFDMRYPKGFALSYSP